MDDMLLKLRWLLMPPLVAFLSVVLIQEGQTFASPVQPLSTRCAIALFCLWTASAPTLRTLLDHLEIRLEFPFFPDLAGLFL